MLKDLLDQVVKLGLDRSFRYFTVILVLQSIKIFLYILGRLG